MKVVSIERNEERDRSNKVVYTRIKLIVKCTTDNNISFSVQVPCTLERTAYDGGDEYLKHVDVHLDAIELIDADEQIKKNWFEFIDTGAIEQEIVKMFQ